MFPYQGRNSFPETAQITPNGIDCLCYTRGPGMGAPLQVAAIVVRVPSQLCKKPIVAVNHCVALILTREGLSLEQMTLLCCIAWRSNGRKCRELYYSIVGTIARIDEITDRLTTFPEHNNHSSSITRKLCHAPLVDSLYIEDDEIVGIESPKYELIGRLLAQEDQSQAVISVVGMHGLGRTTLVKNVYNSQEVATHFDCKMWIRGIDSLIGQLRGYLYEKSYFIVFDDVWKTDFWEYIRHALPKNSKGSRVIITTCNEQVAAFCKETSIDHVHELQPLSEENAWELFCKKAFRRDFGVCPSELGKVSLKIVRKCEGLPLAIVAIGDLLSTKKKVTSEWQKFYNSMVTDGQAAKEALIAYTSCKFKLLNVLDLEGAPLDQLHKEVGNLYLLRYLSVRRTEVQTIPKSIGHLHNLLTLDLKHSPVSELTIDINRFHKLQHLLAYYHNCGCANIVHIVRGVRIQGGIGHLQELQKLWHVETNHDDGLSLIEELGNLMQLRKLGITKLRREHGRALWATIKKMNYLKYLKVAALSADEILDLEYISSPPQYLQRLSNDPLKALQALPSLEHLHLWNACDEEQLYFEVGSFQKLKQLDLLELEGLNSLIIEEGALPLLERAKDWAYPATKRECNPNPTKAKNIGLLSIYLMSCSGLGGAFLDIGTAGTLRKYFERKVKNQRVIEVE
ncbi:hypothetical protein TEA_003165 [Camellia sinensis var. sinensis]|uniref:NB-ARC domain-containing protein n=1 Tax=Camellia sinensis var. sinensis TaxID=542762 RepID=A0A4S4EWN5_CAMSN|nr:hypothetical protein TEA_003165 [Camellia sinensis var. sinensis]